MTFMRSSDTLVRQFELFSQFVAFRIMTILLVYFIIRWLCWTIYDHIYISTLPVPSVNTSLNYWKLGKTSIINLFMYVLNVLAGMSLYISKVWYIQISINSDTSWYLFLCLYIIPISNVWAVDDIFVKCLRCFFKV